MKRYGMRLTITRWKDPLRWTSALGASMNAVVAFARIGVLEVPNLWTKDFEMRNASRDKFERPVHD